MAPMASPACGCCGQLQAKFFCEPCISEGVITLRQTTSQTLKQNIALVERSDRLLSVGQSTPQAWRQMRAEIARSKRRCDNLRRRIESIDQAIAERGRQGPGPSCRTSDPQSTWRDTRQSPPAHDARQSLVRLKESLVATDRLQADVTRRLADARRVLVREAIVVFGVRRSQDSVWEIAGLPLPSPERLRLHRSYRVNGALVHITHLLSLITRYLGIGLPFFPILPRPHIGRPRMKANVPFVGTTRFHDEPVLWMSSTSRADTADKPKSQSKHRRFLTAFALLAHSVAYLAHTQGATGILIPEDDETTTSPSSIPVWAILRLIDSIVSAPGLGTFSHEPGSTRSAAHLLYGLDVAQVVGAVIRAEERRWGIHRLSRGDLSEGWDLIDSAEEGATA